MKTTMSLALASILSVSAAMADVTETKDYTFELNDGGRISLSNVNGDIRITGVEGSQVRITAVKTAGTQEYLKELEVIIDASADAIRIETKHPDGVGGWLHWGKDSNGSVDYELSVPQDSQLDTIETVNGDVTINGARGRVSVESVNGDLTLEGLSGDVNMDTVNGSLKAQFEVLGAGQRISADAVNGSVVLKVPANASARINAESLNGNIDAEDFGLDPDKGFVGSDLAGQVGEGEARVNIDTVNGSITIKKSQ